MVQMGRSAPRLLHTIRVGLVGLVGLACLLQVTASQAQRAPARAAVQARARATVSAAYQAYYRKDFMEAQRLLLVAYQQTRDERLFYALGRTWEEMGHPLLAMYGYERFLQRAREASSRRADDARIARARLAARLGRLVPRGPAGAWFQVDGGRRHRVADGPLWVWPGEHTVRTANGEIGVNCPAGERETMTLRPIEAEEAPGEGPGARPAVGPGQGDLDSDDDDDNDDDDDDGPRRPPARGSRAERRRAGPRAPLALNAPEGPAGAEPPPPPLTFEGRALPGGAYLLDAFEAEPPPRRLAAQEVASQRGEDRARGPRLSLSVAPLLRSRRLVIDGDPAVPAQGCYSLNAVLPEDPARGEPRGFTYQALPACPSHAATTGGIGVEAEYFPFDRAGTDGQRNRWIAGLGLHAALDLLLPTPGNGTGVESELGLRWVLGDLLRRGDRLGLLLDWRVVHAPLPAAARLYPTDLRGQPVEGGVVGADAGGLPSATYHSLGLGLGLAVPYARVRGVSLSLGLEGRYLALLAAGEIAALVREAPPFSGGYGPVTRGQGHGGLLRITPVEARLRPDLSIAVQLSYEGYRMRFRVADPAFGGPLPPEVRGDLDGARFLAPGAREDRFGLQVSLQYHLGR